ncbi:hypothetical protein Taro_017911, partial [Colocasia esculenta]|nr:hypothetical protein [Colocasia esculenta]
MEQEPMELLRTAADEVSTSSTKQRIRIFREVLPAAIRNSVSADFISSVVDIIFKTVPVYDDRPSRIAVDDLIIKVLHEAPLMKSFAAALVLSMEKQVKLQTPVGGYKLLKWSCLLLRWTQFTSVSKNAFSRLAVAQASLLKLLLQGCFSLRRACKKLFFHLFSKSPDIYKMYIEELKDSRISYREGADLTWIILDFLTLDSSSFGQYKPIFLDLYLKAVLNAKEKPSRVLTDAFHPLLQHLTQEDFKDIIFPSSLKMLKRNPELVLESVGDLLSTTNLDLSKYAIELLSVILSQVRHADERRRSEALAVVGCLSQRSSDPDALSSMFSTVKAVIGGSEGKLAFPYQRVGMFNALEELSKACSVRQLNSLASSISTFFLSSYKDEGNEDVKLAILSALSSWAGKSAEAVQPDVVSFFAVGLKEKETLRKGHLRCLRLTCKNQNTLTRLSTLLDPLVQVVKTSFTKAAQRLEGIYVLFSLLKIFTASKLGNEDCMACIDLLEVLLVDHVHRLDASSVKSMLQIMLHLICHPSWQIRKVAYDATSKVISASSLLAENLLAEFLDLLSVVGVITFSMKLSDTENSVETQIPSAELLVKVLLLIAPSAVSSGPQTCAKIIFCSHHPCISFRGQRGAVWKRLQRKLRKHGFDICDFVSENISVICKELLGPMGLMSTDSLKQQAAIGSFATLMSITPNDTFLEFEQVFYTPEGVVSSEQGVYVAESVANRNIKLAKGRFKVYDDQDSPDHPSSIPTQREPIKREAVDKVRTAKEEARELLLKEESSTREKVKSIQKNLSMVLKALGEMAVANAVFAHGQLPLLVKLVDPLLRSPIVSDAAFETMLKLARCLAPPLCDWAPEIAAALRIISTQDMHIVLELIPPSSLGENNQSLSLFEQIIAGLLTSCKSGPLPADSFTVIFPILQRILSSSKKTSLHDDVLRILSLHLDPILPLPRLQMLSVLYHVLGVVPASLPMVGPMLNELCLGLKSDDMAQALCGIYAKDVHVRLACLNAIKCIPCVTGHSIPRNMEIATSIWIALHDPEKVIAEAAEDIWDRYGFEFGTDFSGLFHALSHVNYNVRVAAAEGLAAALDESPDTIQETLSTLFSMYIQDVGSGVEISDSCWFGRQGIALALHSAADVLRTKDLPVVMTFLIARALADPNVDVRGRMINAGIMIIDKHGKENVSLLFPIFENYLNKKDDPKVNNVVEKLLDVLNTPSEAVQRAVSDCLSPLMASQQVLVSF